MFVTLPLGAREMGKHSAASGAATPDSSFNTGNVGSGKHDGGSVPKPPRWLQALVVRGNALRRLLAVTSLTVSDQNNTVALRGVGSYFPGMEGLDWAAMCAPLEDTDSPLSDIRPIVDMLVRESLLVTTDASRDEVEAFMRGSA